MSKGPPPIRRKLSDSPEWDGAFTKRVDPESVDDGLDRQSPCYTKNSKGQAVFNAAKFQERLDRHERMRSERSDLVFRGIVANEVSFLQFFERDEFGREVRVFYSQAPMMLDTVVVGYCGRDTGKTWTIKSNGAQRATEFPNGSLMVTSHDNAHVEPRAQEMFKLVTTHPFFRQLIPKRPGSYSRKPPYMQEFTNGFTWHGVYPGDEAKQLEKYHVNGTLADESQELDDLFMQKWQPTQNAFKAERGSIVKFFGVNTQGRMDTPFYRMTFQDEFYMDHVYVVPSWNNPREYTLEKHAKFLKLYGGSVESPLFKQMIRGQLGDATRGVFNARHYEQCIDLRTRLCERLNIDVKDSYRKRVYTDEYLERQNYAWPELIKYPLPLKDYSEIRIGMDFGFGGGWTVIEVWFLYKDFPTLGNELWHLGETFVLHRVHETRQAEFLHFLMNDMPDRTSLYPMTTYAGIDVTGNRNAYGILTDKNDARYNSAENRYDKRLIPIHFERPIVVDKVIEEPAPTIRKQKTRLPDGSVVWEILDDSKFFLFMAVAARMRDGGYSLPPLHEDQDRFAEFMGINIDEKSKGRTFTAVRKRDHTVAANACFEAVCHLKSTISGIEEQLLASLYDNAEQAGGYSIYVDF